MASGTSTYSAWQPSIVLPKLPAAHGLQAVLRAGAVLRAAAAQARALWPLGVIAPAITRCPSRTVHGRAELLDDAHWLVADRESAGDRVLAFEDVDVGAADGGRGHADQRVERSDIGDRLFVEHDAPGSTNTAAFILALCGRGRPPSVRRGESSGVVAWSMAGSHRPPTGPQAWTGNPDSR